jgi:hypothetical protein
MRILISAIAFVGCLFAQADTVRFSAVGPPNVGTVSATRLGNAGSNTFYYWVVSNWPIGKAIPARVQVNQAPNTLTATTSIRLNWTPNGATSYDVLRTTTASLPSSCVCALATGLVVGVYTDIGGAFGPPYVVTSVGTANASIRLDNRNQSVPELIMDLPLQVPSIISNVVGPWTKIGTTISPTVATDSVATSGTISGVSLRAAPGVVVKPACVVGLRGTIWNTPSGAGIADVTEVCAKKDDDTFAWVSVGSNPNTIIASAFETGRSAPALMMVHDHIPFTAFTTAATVQDFVGSTLPAKFKATGITVTNTTPLTGPGITTWTVSMGPAGAETAYFPELPQASADTPGAFIDFGEYFSTSASAVGLIYRFKVTNGAPGNWGLAGVTRLTAGAIDIWIVGTVLP